MVARWWEWALVAAAPCAVAAEWLHADAVTVFLLSALAVVPLAAFIGESTGHLAHRVGPSFGALINATFGNLAEMIIAGFAVRAGLLGVVKVSLTGAILGNLLFVGGLSMLVGGWKRDSQKFSRLSSEASAGQMVLATAALLLPALFFYAGDGQGKNDGEPAWPMSRAIVTLGAASVAMAVVAEGLVGAVATVGQRWGL